MKPATIKHPHAFTLIELLVVISIISLLVAILLPALGKARTTAQMASSLAGVRQITMAQLNYATDNRFSLPYLSYLEFSPTANHPRPMWSAKLLQLGYVSNKKIYWSPGRDTSQINLVGDNFHNGNPWYYTGYGMNVYISVTQKTSESYTNYVAASANGLHYPLDISSPRTPPHSKFLLLVENSTDEVGLTYPQTNPGWYIGRVGTNTSTSNNIFTYNGAAVHSYLDGHGSSDSGAIGWIPTSKFYGRWMFTNTGSGVGGTERVAPWHFRWWRG